ncbi:MAG TPA: mechanosensitive ion channel domain-containing protein [Casimicrobiaceae bacterium]|nr:mechanosensitive ion channel domain-containing protein [Casimicrobiaceae bacterium]
MEFLGIKWLGVTSENAEKLLVSIIFIVGVLLVRLAARVVARALLRDKRYERKLFWTRQVISIVAAIALIFGVLSIWFDDPRRLTTAAGLVTAGLAFALQKVITSIAGYVVILRGNNFTVGDRIVMGGVRGDVIALGFMQTKIMEMGEPPAVQSADPAMWVKSRQFTGRIVSVSNSRIFDEPIYNYTRDFPFIWEEISVPVSYRDDRHAAERILLDVARRHTRAFTQLTGEARRHLETKYFVHVEDLEPRVFWRITDNWLELTVRFVVKERGVREVKDAMSRDILAALDEARIGIASATYDIVGMPPLVIERKHSD